MLKKLWVTLAILFLGGIAVLAQLGCGHFEFRDGLAELKSRLAETVKRGTLENSGGAVFLASGSESAVSGESSGKSAEEGKSRLPFQLASVSRARSPLWPAAASNFSPRLALVRLEDVGPGGAYATLENLGKLRAVVDYLYEHKIPFHVTVIPRFKVLRADGQWEERGIDDPSPSAETLAFIRLLHYMEDRGGILGIHGYTHQYGAERRADGQQDSGSGCEFALPDAADSWSRDYARERLEKAVEAFKKAGFQPAFWETPHNVAASEQREVFRSGLGIQYESLNKKDLEPVYLDEETYYFSSSRGTVYVPTPLYYVEGGAGTKNSVESILQRMMFFTGLASFFYHPFLEFSFLEPVLDAEGKPVVVDGLPLYRYREGEKSYLQRLIEGLQEWGYRFASLPEVVPFTPGPRVVIKGGAATEFLGGDFNGDGREDVSDVGEGRVQVSILYLDCLRWKRDASSRPWLYVSSELKDAVCLAGDVNKDGKQDVIFYRRESGSWRVALSRGQDFSVPQQWLEGWAKGGKWEAAVGDFNGDGRADLLVFDRNARNWQLAFNAGDRFIPQPTALSGVGNRSVQFACGDVNGDGCADLILYYPERGKIEVCICQKNGRFAYPAVWLANAPESGELLAGDLNGDGRCDVVVREAAEGKWWPAFANGDEFVSAPRSFGPWGKGVRGPAFLADFDGNRRKDLAMISRVEGTADTYRVDIAYSFLR